MCPTPHRRVGPGRRGRDAGLASLEGWRGAVPGWGRHLLWDVPAASEEGRGRVFRSRLSLKG